MPRMWLYALLLFGQLEASGEESVRSYPAYLEGKSGFLYSLQIDSQSRPTRSESGRLHYFDPVLAHDSSPLYIGRKTIQGPAVKVSLRQLYRDSLLASQPEPQVEYRSERWDSAFQVRLYPGLVAGLLNHLQKNREDFRERVSEIIPGKTSLMDQLLFDDEFVLTDADLKSIRQTDLLTEPPAVQIEIKISSSVDLENLIRDQLDLSVHQWAGDLLKRLNEPVTQMIDSAWKMAIVIQVENLRFHIREKRIYFDPETQRIRVDILADRTQISGPLRELGEMKKLINWRGYEEEFRLENGEIGEMLLSLALELKRESPEFWILSADPRFFTLDFLDDPAIVKLHVTGTSSKGVPRDEKGEVALGREQQVEVLNALSRELTQALGARFFSDSFALALKKKPLLPSAEEVGFQAWIREIRFRQEGIDALFDAQYELAQIHDCIADRAGSYSAKRVNFDSIEGSGGRRWGYLWNREDEVWRTIRDTGEPPHEVFASPQRVSFAHSLEFLQWLSHAAWLSGEFCIDSSLWWPRPAHIPYMEARLLEPPRIEMNEEGEMDLELHGQIKSFSREAGESRDSFSKNSLDKMFRGRVRLNSLDPGVEWKNIDLQLEGLSAEENDFIKNLVLIFLEQVEFLAQYENKVEGPEVFSLRQWAEQLGKGDFKFESFDWNPQRWQTNLDLLDFGRFLKLPKEPEVSSERVALRTRMIDPPEYWIEEPILKLSWEVPGMKEEVFFSWRLIEPGKTESETSWSSFMKEDEVQLVLSEEGLHEFEVRAMNRDFEIEFPSNARIQFYYLGEQNQDESYEDYEFPAEDSDKESEEKTDDEQEDRVSQKTEVNRIQSKGAFGCSMDSNSQLSLWPWLVALISLFFLRRYGASKPQS